MTTIYDMTTLIHRTSLRISSFSIFRLLHSTAAFPLANPSLILFLSLSLYRSGDFPLNPPWALTGTPF